MTKLAISEIEFKNFLSYGDYENRLNLANMGPVLIVGDKSDNGTRDFRKSNGAGKSTITTAIIWALFGKTFTLSNPGDKVVNWHIDKDCFVKLKTVDGWEITRTRKMDGYNELSVFHDGEDKTLSTATNTQQFLNKQFGLDFDIFTSSVFFGQFSRPFLEMADQKRKAALERLLNLDKLNIWASTAKDKMDKADIELTKCSTKIEAHDGELVRLDGQVVSIEQLKEEYESERAQKVSRLEDQQASKQQEFDSVEIPDIQKLKDRWVAIGKIEDKLKIYENKLRLLEEEESSLEGNVERNTGRLGRLDKQIEQAQEYNLDTLAAEHQNRDKLLALIDELESSIRDLQTKSTEKELTLKNRNKTIEEWKQASGQICTKCKQAITSEHTENMCKPIIEEATALQNDIAEIGAQLSSVSGDLGKIPEVPNPIALEEAEKANASVASVREDVAQMQSENTQATRRIRDISNESKSITTLIGKVRKQADAAKPSITVAAALELESGKKLLQQSINTIIKQIKTLNEEANPHSQQLLIIQTQIADIKSKLEVARQARSKLHVFYTHLAYVRSAYKDRKKIKQFILSSLIPLLNKRIQYYLESFNCEFAMEFTPTLSMLPSKWDYSLCSGGERKRIDMSVMFALYDLYIYMHGQQCNIMVLDEVDGRLDSEGIEAFIDVVTNDFCDQSGTKPRPTSILIISHRPEMLDAFPSKIMVRKKEGFSFIESII
jgi:DNA repair exonuclease SbcCD ATPase subunit